MLSFLKKYVLKKKPINAHKECNRFVGAIFLISLLFEEKKSIEFLEWLHYFS